MQRATSTLRLLLATAFVAGVLSPWYSPTMVSAQTGEPCEVEGEETGPCVDLEHVYEGDCVGNDCYTAMEWCCLPGVGT